MTTQRNTRYLLAAVTVAALAAIGAAAWLHWHGDPPDHDAGPAALVLNDGARWATDPPLRQGMARVRDAVAPVAAVGRAPSRAEADALAERVRGEVSYMVANCKLEPKADAVLHVLIGELLTGADALAADPPAPEGLKRIVAALDEYPRYFEHAGWQPLPAAH